MNRRVRTISFLLLPTFVLLLTACTQKVVRKQPTQIQQADRHNLLGIAAESRLQLTVADAEFMEAFRLHSGVEHYHGMVMSLVNRSRLYRSQGETAKTEKVLQQAVQLMPHVPELKVEVCFEMSKLALMKGNHDDAVNWANRGVESADAVDMARMLNLQALTFMQKSFFQEASIAADSALKASRGTVDKREEANALRILGDLAYADNRFNESLEKYEAALSIDKELAISSRISDDLRRIARSLTKSGGLSAAMTHYQRSLAINLAEHDLKRGAEDQEILRILSEQINGKVGSSNASKSVEKLQ